MQNADTNGGSYGEKQPALAYSGPNGTVDQFNTDYNGGTATNAPYSSDSAENGAMANAATGAVAGGTAGGPWGALIGAAAGLIGGLMNNKAASERQKYEAATAEHARTQNALQAAQQNQMSIAGNMGTRENSAIQNLLGVFARAR